MHISLYVDEDAESDALHQTDRLVRRAADLANLRLEHQYMYPDGSWFAYACTSTVEVFERKLNVMRRFLNRSAAAKALNITLEATPVESVSRGYTTNSLALNLVEKMRRRCLYDGWYIPDLPLLDPLNSWGGMTLRDAMRYREHRAFKDGFLAAFGHACFFWTGPPEYVPTQRAQEQAGAGYALGALLHLLCYTGETEAARVGI